MPIVSVNPATGEIVKKFRPLSDEEISQKLDSARKAFLSYRRSTFSDRAEKMLRAADILESEKAEFGRLMTLEMGKTLKSAVEEAVKCAWGCRFYAENAETFLADEVVKTNASKSFVRYEPLGPILAVMPWNFPFWQVIRFAAPALMAGNVGLLKHASTVPQCALALEGLFRRAGFPEGVFQTLLIGSDQVERVLSDPLVRAATLTGSEPAGRSVAALSGKLIKKTVLELGGSDPFIILPSAALDEAIATAVKARVINNGQSCIAAKRFIVDESIAQSFEERFVELFEKLCVGDPMDEKTDVGPLATPGILDILDDQVRRTVAAGGTLLTGGRRLPRSGNFYAPTIIANIPRTSPAYSEELFGPVAAVFHAKNVHDAVGIANDSPFGLGASVWTRDREEQQYCIDNVEAGCIFINGMVASDPRLPFGGVKNSGYGRELSVFGIREFVNIKTVWIRDS